MWPVRLDNFEEWEILLSHMHLNVHDMFFAIRLWIYALLLIKESAPPMVPPTTQMDLTTMSYGYSFLECTRVFVAIFCILCHLHSVWYSYILSLPVLLVLSLSYPPVKWCRFTQPMFQKLHLTWWFSTQRSPLRRQSDTIDLFQYSG